MSDESVINIKLTIANRVFPMVIKPQQEEGFRKAAKFINDSILRYEQKYHIKDKQDSLSMLAIELAYQQAQTEIDDKEENIEVKERLERLHQRIDALLNEK